MIQIANNLAAMNLLDTNLFSASLLGAINWHSTLFMLFALLACGFAIAVVATSNVVRMAFYLTLSLGAISGLFFLAGAEFVGAMQLMIYVGGTLVLLIFGVMLTAQARFVSMQTSAGEWVLAAVVGSSLLLLLFRSALGVPTWSEPRPDAENVTLADAHTSSKIGTALAGIRVDKLDEESETLRNGMSGYLMPFVVISMHLLVVLIGAGYMARTKRARSASSYLQTQPHPQAALRKWSLPVLGGLASAGVVNAILAVVAFSLASGSMAASEDPSAPSKAISAVAGLFASSPAWLLPILGLLFALNVLLAVVTYLWQKWGVIGLVIVPLAIGGLLVAGNVVTWAAAAIAVALLAPAAMLVVLLCTTGKPTAWEMME